MARLINSLISHLLGFILEQPPVLRIKENWLRQCCIMRR